MAKAKADSDALAAGIAADAQRDVAEINRSRDSAQQLQRRQRTLQTKQAVLNETIDMALESLYKLPDVDYFVLLVRLAARAAQPGEGVMYLNEKDRARLPAEFETHLAKALPAGAKLTLSDKTRPIDGGFVLGYGGVEENCSFEAIFSARHDEFSDMIRDILFS